MSLTKRKGELVSDWDTRLDGEMTLAAVRNKYKPSASYRISKKKIPASDSYAGVTRAAVCHILRGQCRIAVGGNAIVGARAGQFVSIIDGSYRIDAFPGEDVEMVWVWELPEEFRK